MVAEEVYFVREVVEDPHFWIEILSLVLVGKGVPLLQGGSLQLEGKIGCHLVYSRIDGVLVSKMAGPVAVEFLVQVFS